VSVDVRRRIVIVFLINCIAYGCATTTQAPALPAPEAMHGEASWYGQEFAGRTTANGEIFDPLLMTAAHRSLPFGTVVDVKNSANGQTVRVRINDRGPYVGNRLIDLTYAAAQQISLIEPGHGEVDLTVVKVGRGDREPPAPYVVSIPDVGASSTPARTVPAPIAEAPADVPPVTVDRVQVVEEHASQPGVETRRVVGADGRTIQSVPIAPVIAPTPVPQPAVRNTPPPAPAPQPRPVAPSTAGKFVVQVGAFAQEPNAKELQGRLTKIGQQSYIDRSATLYRVRIGPFATREQAIAARAKLEAAGISAIVIAP
jgi:rare lipoprotein A